MLNFRGYCNRSLERWKLSASPGTAAPIHSPDIFRAKICEGGQSARPFTRIISNCAGSDSCEKPSRPENDKT